MEPLVMGGREYWPGCYAGEVVANEVGNGRLRVRVPMVYSDDTADSDLPDCRPCFSRGANWRGDDPPVPVGDQVWVMFEAGDASYPVWIGEYLMDSEERASNRKEITSGTKEQQIVEDKVTTIGGTESRVIKQSQVVTARRRQEEYRDKEVVVLNTEKYTVGRREGTIKGKDEKKVEGSVIWEVLGTIEEQCSDSKTTQAGGNVSELSVGTFETKGLNSTLTSIPIAGTAWKGVGFNGATELTANPITGLPFGGQLRLDPLGLTNILYSQVNQFIQALGTIFVQAPLIMLGYSATLPGVNMAHCHLGNMGVITGPAIPNPTMGGLGLAPTIFM